jgi:lipid-A-disaccharide synthase
VNLLTTNDLFPQRVSTYDPTDPVDSHVLMPEYLTCEDKSERVASHVVEWLTEPEKRKERVSEMAALREKVGHGGASAKAAEYLLDAMDRRPRRLLRTHFSFAGRLEEAARGAA